MIKTTHKMTPPKGESYVLNATEISALLDGIPQYNEFSISFSFSNTEYYRNAKNGLHAHDISVLEIRYYKSEGRFFARDRLKSGEVNLTSWSVHLRAIASSLRKPLNRIVTEIFNKDIRRLCFDLGSCAAYRSRSIDVAYNFARSTVLLKETVDDCSVVLREIEVAEHASAT
jgi:hypothetical protein